MATVQTSRGAETYIRVMPDVANGAVASSVLNLQDGTSVRQDASGGFTVRTIDLGPLQSAGFIAAGASTSAAFQAGRISLTC